MLGMAKKKRPSGDGLVRRHASGLWEARISIPGGKPKSFYGKSQAEALTKRDAFRVQMLSGIDLDADKLTLAEYLYQWLTSVQPSVASSTYRRYEQAVRCHLTPHLGSVKLSKVGPGHVELLKGQLIGGGMSAGSAKTTLVVLSTALNRAVKWRLIDHNPARAVSNPRVPPPDYVCLTEAQATALVGHVRGTRHEALYHVALKYGPRAGELSALTWGDLHLDRGTLTIRKSKTGTGRTLQLSSGTVACLKRHRKIAHGHEVPKLGGGKTPLFPNTVGRPLAGSVMRRQLAKHLKEAGLPEIRFHDLRDTAATLMLEDGFPVHRVARILGHADPAMTLRRYAHVLSELEESGAERLDRWAF